MRRLYLSFILLIAVLVSISACGGEADKVSKTGLSPIPEKVKVAVAGDRVAVLNKIRAFGRIEPEMEALLSAPIDAKVSVLRAGLDERVKKGELLVELRGVPGSVNYVISPIDGRVVEVFVEEGERLSVGDELLRIKNMMSVRVTLKIPVLHFDDLRVGQDVRVSVPALPGLRFVGSVYSVEPVADDLAVSFEIQAIIRNPQGKLKAGLKAKAVIDTGIIKEVFVIPASALVERGGRPVVYTIVDDQTVEKEVKILRKTGNYVHILEGLAPQDFLVVEGAAKLTNDAQVIVIE